jgi:hypothetical protein
MKKLVISEALKKEALRFADLYYRSPTCLLRNQEELNRHVGCSNNQVSAGLRSSKYFTKKACRAIVLWAWESFPELRAKFPGAEKEGPDVGVRIWSDPNRLVSAIQSAPRVDRRRFNRPPKKTPKSLSPDNDCSFNFLDWFFDD